MMRYVKKSIGLALFATLVVGAAQIASAGVGDIIAIEPVKSVPDAWMTAQLLGASLLGFGLIKRRLKS